MQFIFIAFSNYCTTTLRYLDLKFCCFSFILYDFTAALTLLLVNPSYVTDSGVSG